jgi:ribosomal protein S18 acetylase RimI-like enzyme
VTVRRLRAGDARLGAAVVGTFKGRRRSPRTMASFLRDQRNVLVVAEDERRPLGFALAYELDRVDEHAPMMLLYEIEVAGTARGRGIGWQLVGALRRHCERRGGVKMWVLTDEDNTAAMALYRSTGGVRRAGETVLFEYRTSRTSR